MGTSIVWYQARNAKGSGLLEHRFKANGDHAGAVWAWLAANNQHGEWLIPATAPPGDFKFLIHENPADPLGARRTRGHIAYLKLSAANVPDLKWHKH